MSQSVNTQTWFLTNIFFVFLQTSTENKAKFKAWAENSKLDVLLP